jgi:ribonucleoside-diphosphate reductase alpha chain
MSYDVPPLDKMRLVAEAQKWIDSSISITFNLPEEATVDAVKEIYMQAWKQGLKGITVYRDNSLSGVLITEKNYDQMTKEQVTPKKNDNLYEPRPEVLPCDIYETKYKETSLIVLVGLKDGEPYEVFISPNNDGAIDVEKHKTGKIKKVKSGHYDLIVENGEVKTMINNISKTFDSVYGTLSRMVSMSLRSKVPLNFIVDQLNKDSGFVAFEKVLSRILKKYIKDNTKTKDLCPVCSSPLVFSDGCKTCISCGWSKCD